MFTDSLFSHLGTMHGARSITILMIVFACILLLIKISGLPIVVLIKKFLGIIGKFVGKLVNKREERYHRDIAIGKITEKRASYKLYNFLSELIIDLNLLQSGITPYELLLITCFIVTVVVSVVCKLLFGTYLMAIPMVPIAIVGTFSVMYTRANIAHDARIENVIEAENVICNNIKVGVVVAIRESLDVIPKEVRPYFKDFIDNVEQKNYHVKTALQELNMQLGSIADDFIKKCIVFEMEEEHGIAGMFQDIVEINNIRMEMRTEMKRRFEEVKTDFLIGAGMIFAFMVGVLWVYPDVRTWYFTTGWGQVLIALDVLLLIIEFVFITYLRAKEL